MPLQSTLPTGSSMSFQKHQSQHVPPRVLRNLHWLPYWLMLMMLKWKYGNSRFATPWKPGQKPLLLCINDTSIKTKSTPKLLSSSTANRTGSLLVCLGKSNYQPIGKGQCTGHLWVPKDVHTLGPAELSGPISPSLYAPLFYQHKALHWAGSYLQFPKAVGLFWVFCS